LELRSSAVFLLTELGFPRQGKTPKTHAPQVPVDDRSRPYPYVLPPTFPGAYPTISFAGTPEEKQAAGLHPYLHARMLVRYAGIANSPVKVPPSYQKNETLIKPQKILLKIL
jgi:hypothetical protein